MLKHLLYLLLWGCLCACTPHSSNPASSAIHYTMDSLHYAQHFSIARTPNYTRLTIHNPWQTGKTLGNYYLVKHDSIHTPHDGIKLIVPLQRIGIQSAPHMGFIDALQQATTVVGACSPQLFYSPALQEQYQQGQVAHLGDAYQMNLEKITQIAPQALFTTAYPQADKQTQRLQALNIPIIATVEWTEPNLLARAEWIKAWGVLLDKEQLADSIFTATAQHYHDLTQLAKTATNPPSIMSGLPYKDTWYMPGGNSFMGQLFKHANVSYHYSNNTENSSLPLSFETVWYHFNQATLWVGIDANTTKELLQIDQRLSNFKAVQKNQLYHYRKRTTPQGGNDFWESAVVYPNRLLNDLIHIAHPTLTTNYTPYYTAPLP